MTFLHDDQLAEVSSTPTAALSCAGTARSIARRESTEQSRLFWQPMRFPSLRRTSAAYAGVRPGWKLGPEDNSHKFHSIAVFPGRNVA
ncbi:hypothetical protein [Mycobacterium sp. SM3041]|uniref:hypothetical protein n=1 Tax=Mycobacterium sp. SM3041 TaxID=3114291 RepID=UPI003204FA18